MSYTYGQFRASVKESLENDQRFEALLDEACNRGIDETLIDSNYGNTEYLTPSVNRKEEYDLPPGTLHVNYVTYDSIKLDRLTMDEWLSRKQFRRVGFSASAWPDSFLVRDNRLLAISNMPNQSGKEIVIYCSVKERDFVTGTDDAVEIPFARLYSKAAWHFARHFCLSADGQTTRAQEEYQLFEHEEGKANIRLRGSVKTKVKRVV